MIGLRKYTAKQILWWE